MMKILNISGEVVLKLGGATICSDKVITTPDFMLKFRGCNILFSGCEITEKGGEGEASEMPTPATTFSVTKDSIPKIWLDEDLSNLDGGFGLQQ